MNNDKLIKYIQSKINEKDAVLDIGCGNKRGHSSLVCSRIIGVDAWSKFVPDFVIDLEKKDLPFGNGLFEIVLMIDFIEHISNRKRGLEIVEQAKMICSKYVILMTPLKWDENRKATEDPRSPYCGNEYNYHRTLWKPFEFNNIGFIQVYNVMPPKYYLGIWENV